MLVTKPYDRFKAVEYARRWALDRNPLFFSFNGIGGDCTNFASQCIFAGSCVMNYTPTYGWYYISSADRTASWSGVEFFYEFLTENAGQGPFARTVGREEAEIGDIIQFGNSEGFYHTVIITRINGDEILIAAHSNDALDRNLNTYEYDDIRFLHIEGIRLEIPIRNLCFDTLIRGGIQPNEEEIVNNDETN